MRGRRQPSDAGEGEDEERKPGIAVCHPADTANSAVGCGVCDDPAKPVCERRHKAAGGCRQRQDGLQMLRGGHARVGEAGQHQHKAQHGTVEDPHLCHN